MTIEAIVRGSRLYSCMSTDTKPSGWASGLIMLEQDTGDWYYTDAQGQWTLCGGKTFAPVVHPHLDVTQIPHAHDVLPGSVEHLVRGDIGTGPPQRVLG